MSRSNALANDASHRFIDPISLDLMKDPVIAADGHYYDRETITTWFATLRAQGRQITSPGTNLPLQDEILTPNTALKRDLDIFIASMSTVLPADIQFTLSSEIFKELDRISSMSEMSLLDFQAPKIVVLGNESHGKSMILERVIGLPLFPKEKGICTRCVVRVHMRRSVADEPSLAEIYVQNVFAGGKIIHQNEPPRAPQIVALDNIREKIKEAMDDLVRNDPQQRMVIDDHEIIVKVTLPYCLNVDILDLPGLVTTSPPFTTQNLPQVTKEIAMRVIREQKDSSFFLLVNDVRVPPNQSRGCEVVQEAKIEGQTLGIFTKVDTFVSEDGSEAAELQQLLKKGGGAFPLGYGWMAAASRSVDVVGATNKLQAFQLIDQNESRFFQERYAPLIRLNKLGIQRIRQRIQILYESFVHNHWTPVILTKLNATISVLERKMHDLGTPLPPDNDYIGFMGDWGENMRIHLPTLTEEKTRQFFKDVLDRLFLNCEEELIGLKEDEGFWDLMNHYHMFIGEEDEKVAHNEYANGNIKKPSQGNYKQKQQVPVILTAQARPAPALSAQPASSIPFGGAAPALSYDATAQPAPYGIPFGGAAPALSYDATAQPAPSSIPFFGAARPAPALSAQPAPSSIPFFGAARPAPALSYDATAQPAPSSIPFFGAARPAPALSAQPAPSSIPFFGAARPAPALSYDATAQPAPSSIPFFGAARPAPALSAQPAPSSIPFFGAARPAPALSYDATAQPAPSSIPFFGAARPAPALSAQPAPSSIPFFGAARPAPALSYDATAQPAPSSIPFFGAARPAPALSAQPAPSSFSFGGATPANAMPQAQPVPATSSVTPTFSDRNLAQSVATYKFDSQTFKRDIPAFEANGALEALETKFKESLNRFHKRLHDRINPDAAFILSIRNSIIKVAAKEDPLFKLERFDVLLAALVQVVKSQFNKIVRSFNEWFGVFVASVYEKPLLHSVYYRDDTIRCKLYWSHPYELHKYPHMILDKFYQCLRENLKSTGVLPRINIASLQEG
eukprot:gene15844-17825_t